MSNQEEVREVFPESPDLFECSTSSASGSTSSEPKKKRVESKVWKYFSKTDGKAVCKSCNKKFSINSTTTLSYHLRTQHKIDCDVGLATIPSSQLPITSYAGPSLSKSRGDDH